MHIGFHKYLAAHRVYVRLTRNATQYAAEFWQVQHTTTLRAVWTCTVDALQVQYAIDNAVTLNSCRMVKRLITERW